MAKVTVTIEGDIDEVMATLQGMAGHSTSMNGARNAANPAEDEPESQAQPETPTTATDGEPEPGETVWNSSYVHTFWRNLSDTARQAMVRVSRSPNHVQKRAQLMHTLQLSQRELSGSLSSQGHSLNRLKRRRGDVNLPRPLTYDKVEDVYILDGNFAEAMGELGLSEHRRGRPLAPAPPTRGEGASGLEVDATPAATINGDGLAGNRRCQV